MVYIAIFSRSLIFIVFAVSAFTKLRSRAAFGMFSAWVATLPILPVMSGSRRTLIAVVVAAAEVVTVPLVALPWTFRAGLILAAGVLAVFAAGVFMVARSQAGAVPCQCFGPSSVPMGMPHAVRNALLCATAAAGAAGAGPAAAQLAGVVLSLGASAAVALPVIFLDDLVSLFAGGGAVRDEGT